MKIDNRKYLGLKSRAPTQSATSLLGEAADVLYAIIYKIIKVIVFVNIFFLLKYPTT